jgi:hypothetical protein
VTAAQPKAISAKAHCFDSNERYTGGIRVVINTITPSGRHPPIQAYPAAGNPSSSDKNMIGVSTQNKMRLAAAMSSPTKPTSPADVLDVFKCKLTVIQRIHLVSISRSPGSKDMEGFVAETII